MTRSLHREAAADLADAFQYYKAEAGVGIAGRLLTEFERITRLLESHPAWARRQVMAAEASRSLCFPTP